MRFSDAKNVHPAEIHRQNDKVLHGGVINEGHVRKCFLRLVRTDVLDEERSGRPYLVTDDLKDKLNAKIRRSPRFTISQPQEIF